MLKYTDILSLQEFEKIRELKKPEIIALKKIRRLSVGPDITFYFENTQTIWWQIHEMLRIEKGGKEQIEDELNAYNPMIPSNTNGNFEIAATMMIEIDDSIRRQVMLKQLFGIDQQVFIKWGNTTVQAFSIDNIERNRESDQKTSSVHFLKWHLLANQVSEFLNSESSLSIDNPFYSFSAKMPEPLKESLKEDFGL